MQAPKDGSRRGGHPLRALVSVALAAMLLFAAGRADAFCTIAGGCAPTGTGHLDITHIGPDQEPVDLAVGVYLADLPPEPWNLIASGRTGAPIELLAGTYDVVIDTTPFTWRRGVTIVRGETTGLTTGGYGRLLVSGLDAAGQPVDEWVFVYTPEDREKPVVVGDTNAALEVPEGVYIVRANLKPGVTFDDVVIRAGETTEVALPAWGRLLLSGATGSGEPVRESIWVYAPGDRNDVIASGDTNEAMPLPPGTYDIYVDRDPDKVYENVSIGAGATVEIALPSYGALLVRGVDAQGKPLFAKGIYLYPAGGGDIVSSGMVNERLDVPAGTYDVDVDLEPDIWHRGVEIAPGATVEIELPQWGELEVRVTDPAGAGVTRLVYLYLSRDDAKSVVAFTDRARLVPPGSYVLRLDPTGAFNDVWLDEPVTIEAGRTVVLELTLTAE